MKVVMVNNLYAPHQRGGAELSVQVLAEALVADGAEVTVLRADRGERPTAELNGVKIVTVAAANLYWPFADPPRRPFVRKIWHLADVYNRVMRDRIERVLRFEQPQVVHTNNLQGITVSTWSAAKRCGLPVMHTLRDYYLTCARSSCFRNGRNCSSPCATCTPFSAARRHASRTVGAVVGTSSFILDRHLEKGFFPRSTIRLVVANAAAREEVARHPQGGRVVFGYLGRLEPAKGADALIGAFADRDDDTWEVVLAGRGQAAYVEELQRSANRALRPGRIRFLGWMDGARLLREIDVVVVPSRWHEPLSRVAIEAQTRGIPVIASRRGGMPEIVQHESTGWLYDPDEPGGLERIIERVVRQPDLVRRYGAAARATADRFSPLASAARYSQAYEELLRSRQPR